MKQLTARLPGLLGCWVHLQVLGINKEVSKLQESGAVVAELPENCREFSFPAFSQLNNWARRRFSPDQPQLPQISLLSVRATAPAVVG